MTEQERWLPIAGYEGFYEVSDLGRVKSLRRQVQIGKRLCWRRERILKIEPDTHGYRRVDLRRLCHAKKHKVARLVALTFGVITPDQDVDHKNRIRHDDKLTNLRPCDDCANNQNRGAYKNSKSGINGVRWLEDRKKWTVHIGYNRKYKFIGNFDKKEIAVEARIAAEKKYHGQFANHLQGA